MNQQNQSVKTSRIKKIAFVFMSIWSTIFGACAQSQYTNVAVEGFEQAIKNDSAQVLDVRTHEEFAESHIKGAVLVDVFSPNFLADAESKLQKERNCCQAAKCQRL